MLIDVVNTDIVSMICYTDFKDWCGHDDDSLTHDSKVVEYKKFKVSKSVYDFPRLPTGRRRLSQLQNRGYVISSRS